MRSPKDDSAEQSVPHSQRLRGHAERGEEGHDEAGHDEAGQALVEFALLLPIVSCCLFAMIYICLAFYSYNMITDTAQDAARFASLRGGGCLTVSSTTCTASASDINNYALAINWPNLAGGTLTASTTFPDSSQTPGSRVLVTVNYRLPNFVPFLPPAALTMSQSSQKIIIQ